MKKLTLIALALGLMVSAAQADTLILSGARYNVFITTPVALGGPEPLVGFSLRVVNKTGDPGYDASAFDGVAFGYTGFTGVMHQHYSAALAPSTPTLDSAQYANNIDTHFAFMTSAMLIINAPSENVAGAGPSAQASTAPPPFDMFGNTDYGNKLTGTFAVTASSNLTLAYFVVKAPASGKTLGVVTSDAKVAANFFISGVKAGEVLNFKIGDVPEPATMGLLAIGGLGALIRRRR